jgi:hypothetical protein
MFFEFVQTEEGWRVFWGGVDPQTQESAIEDRPFVFSDETVEVPVLVAVESDALSVMAV